MASSGDTLFDAGLLALMPGSPPRSSWAGCPCYLPRAAPGQADGGSSGCPSVADAELRLGVRKLDERPARRHLERLAVGQREGEPFRDPGLAPGSPHVL